MNETSYPVTIELRPALGNRNRLTVFFRFLLALPHILLVGGPVALVGSVGWAGEDMWRIGGGAGGLLGLVAFLASIVAWFVLVFTARHPDALWRLGAWYLRWRLRAIAYITLLRDDYPPFGDAEYSAALHVHQPAPPRRRLTVFFRALLALPHLMALWVLSVAWAVTTCISWVAILFTGRYPETLYGFALAVLAWHTRVEAYMLLLRDEYPPFTLRV